MSTSSKAPGCEPIVEKRLSEPDDFARDLPSPPERMPGVMRDAPHPATLPAEMLLRDCELRTQRRSGPGGQHRNKTRTAAFLLHRPTGIVAEATERRSQAENREVALQRLRLRLATEVRSPSVLDQEVDDEERALRRRMSDRGLRIARDNPIRPAVLALLLNDLHASGGQPSVVAPIWRTTTSAVVRFTKAHPPAFTVLNKIRSHHGRGPLK